MRKSSLGPPLTADRWSAALNDLRGKTTPEEESILQLLAKGVTQPSIGKRLGLHRSAVWRRVRRLRLLLDDRAGRR